MKNRLPSLITSGRWSAMKISIVTLFPNLYSQFLTTSIIKTAQDKKLLQVNLINLLDLCEPKARVDVQTVGPGPGMILKPEIVEAGVTLAEENFGPGFKIFFSPKGQVLDQLLLNELASKAAAPELDSQVKPDKPSPDKIDHLILVCSRYEGIDHRVEAELSDMLLSVGNYVLMGGDIPAQILLEGLVRLIPGALGNDQSAVTESFQSPLLDHPEYGLPVEWRGKKVPEVLQSGHHEKIRQHRELESAKLTVQNRFDWFRAHPKVKEKIELAKQVIPNHYVVLMHSQVETGQGVGTTSVTSIDLHDISRSCATYGAKNFFVVTPLKDQRHIVETFLTFWKSENGRNYNKSRFDAVKHLILADGLDQVIQKIEEQENKKPLLMATSAKRSTHNGAVSFWDQGKVWRHERPVLIILGTGRGLEEKLVNNCDFLLDPVEGISGYNHLSVRSAAGIILDRWLAINPKN